MPTPEKKSSRSRRTPPAARHIDPSRKKRPAEPATPEESAIPWSYGVDRIRAMPVDPERLFVYWEVTDEAIERARKKLGSGGPGAWPALRVYETTGRIFDGTNAHRYFDHGIDREERERFFDIDKPGSEAVVELGLKSAEGYFVKIVRSGRVEFPRRAPLKEEPRGWLTVRVQDGGLQPVSHPAAATQESPATAEVPPPHDPDPPAGPTEFELLPDRVEQEPTEWSTEERRVYRSDGKTQVEYGPWEVVIHGSEMGDRRMVITSWEMHRSWITEEGHEVRREVPGRSMVGSSDIVGFGASERRWVAGSELRLAGASELLWRGASERRLGGASERWVRGASERRLRGASEPRLKARSGYPRLDPEPDPE